MFRIHSTVALALAAIVFAGIFAACGNSGDTASITTTVKPSASSSQGSTTTAQAVASATQAVASATQAVASATQPAASATETAASATQAAAAPVGTDNGLCKATATVSVPAPARPNYTQTVTGILTCANGIAPDAVLMHAVWHEQAGDEVCEAVVLAIATASCSRQIGALTSGYEVVIDVTFELNGAVYATTTSFTPQ